MIFKKHNRRTTRQPTKASYWCGCDYIKVGHSGKCPKCGASRKGTKDKKPAPMPERPK